MRKPFQLSLVVVLVMLSATFSFGPASWKQIAELVPTNGVKADWFGAAVAANPNTLAISDFDPNFENYGAVDVFVKPQSGWANMTQSATLTPSDQGLGFGVSVAISENGSVIVVGAANTSNFANSGIAPTTNTPGAVYVFVKPSGGWSGTLTETVKLTASDGVVGDAFGNSVGISGSTIAVGAFFVNNFAGRVYVFTLSGQSWFQAAELTATDGGLLSYLGGSVAIQGETVVAGSIGQNNFQGAVYVFAKPASGWANMTQTAELTAPSGKGSNNLGQSTVVSGNIIAAGEPGALNAKGAVCVYVKPANGWANTALPDAGLRSSNSTAGGNFGASLAITRAGTALLVGASAQSVGSNLEQGAAYLFLEPKSGWKSTQNPYQEFLASDGAQADLMGASVAISGTDAVAGAPKSSAPGVAYIFGK